MIFTHTKIKGVYIIDPEPRTDERGYFERIYCMDELKKQGIKFKIVQINHVMSLKKGTIRGLHMQKPPKSEDKLIQCIRGSIFDVVIDLRKKSPTYGKWVSVVLSEKNKKMLFIPKGFMHGYQVLENNSSVQYPVSEFYSPTTVMGIKWDDPYFNIAWPIKKAILSETDKNWPLFKPAAHIS